MRSPRRYIILAGSCAIALGGTLLVLWLSGDPALIQLAAWRCKTNTCIGLVLGGAALIAASSPRPLVRRGAQLLAVLVTAIGALTLLQYLTASDLGIDQLIANDWPFPESAAHPNRMSPNAALSFV